MTKKSRIDNYADKKFGWFPEGLQEIAISNDYVIGIYYAAFSSTLDPWYMGNVVVQEQSVGSYFPVHSEPKDILRKFSAKVVGVYEIPPFEIGVPHDLKERQYIIHVAYPLEGLDTQFPLLLTTLMGNISMGGKIKLLDVIFPPKFLAEFQGPKFGIEGIRKQLKVPERPFLTNIDHAYTLEDGKSLFYEAAIGGADFIKDDESTAGDIKYLPLEDRVTTYMEMRDQAKEETGEDTVYFVNITAGPNELRENAQKAIDCGTNGLMVNYLTVGLPVVRELAADESIKVPILGHMDFAGVYYESEMSGISSFLIMGKLARLAGLDALVYPSAYSKAPFIRDKYLACAKALRYPFGALKPVLPMPSGGVTPGIALNLIKDLGHDIMIGAGVGIHSHPQGTRAGAKAFRQVIEIGMTNLEEAAEDLEDYLDDHEGEYPELVQAIESWGKAGIKYQF
ncbi:MAG: ribulose 1,5-bisphosphate carboxylase [Candidatus Heimdallarchaeota archaeon]|nr:MAG: ribulose 1,5-bisphosphate carboxylase [Candidatus Heimdallarchaeota archaeon]